MMYSCVLLVVIVGYVSGHGYLQEPPARNAMYKYGFKGAPKNWNLDEQFCGGLTVLHHRNGGKCGVCGDPYHEKQPRRHEVGGSMYDGRIVRTYQSGQSVRVKAHLTTNHWGTMIFRLCPTAAFPKTEVTQECLNQNQLEIVEGQNKIYKLKSGSQKYFDLTIKLPSGLKCERCVLQWYYRAGNNWDCEMVNGKKKCGMGLGPQESFVNCADIKIQ